MPTTLVTPIRPHARPLSPERKLMSAVLDDAIRSYLAAARWSSRGRRAVVDEIRGWMHTERRGSPFDFAVICEALGLDPEATRERVEALRALEAAEPAARRGAAHGIPVSRVRPMPGRRTSASP